MRCIKHSGSTKVRCYRNMPSRPDFQDRGFSLLELIIVVVIILILAAISVPSINRAISTARVRSAAVEYSNLLQTARSRAISDDRFRSLVEDLPAVTYIADFVDSFTLSYISPQLEELFGYAPECWIADANAWVKLEKGTLTGQRWDVPLGYGPEAKRFDENPRREDSAGGIAGAGNQSQEGIETDSIQQVRESPEPRETCAAPESMTQHAAAASYSSCSTLHERRGVPLAGKLLYFGRV